MTLAMIITDQSEDVANTVRAELQTLAEHIDATQRRLADATDSTSRAQILDTLAIATDRQAALFAQLPDREWLAVQTRQRAGHLATQAACEAIRMTRPSAPNPQLLFDAVGPLAGQGVRAALLQLYQHYDGGGSS